MVPWYSTKRVFSLCWVVVQEMLFAPKTGARIGTPVVMRHLACCMLVCLSSGCGVQVGGSDDAASAGVWLAAPSDGALFRPGEPLQLAFERSAHAAQTPWRRVSVRIAFDGRLLGSFGFALGNRTMELAIGAAPEGSHVVTADVQGHTIANVTLRVASGALVLHAGEDRQADGSGRAQLDHWGCLLLGASVSSLPGISAARPLHLWLDGERVRTDDGWLVARVAPGGLHVRGAVTDDFGDVSLENETRFDVMPPPRPLMGDARSDELRTRALDALQQSAISEPASAAASGADEDEGSGRRRPVISCLHPTRARPQEALETRARWLAAASEARDWIEWVFAVDSDDEATRRALLQQLQGVTSARVVSVPVGLGFHAEGTCVGEYSSDISM